MLLPLSFYKQPTLKLAKSLLGTFLVHNSKQGKTIGRIVETEAYLFKDDPACHAARGKTKRNAPMFGAPGRSYVYFIYGMYYCFNVVSGKEGHGEAVLIRALEPISGIPLMEKRRRTDAPKKLCSGPGKLVMAMGIDQSLNNTCLVTGPLKLYSRDSFKKIAPNLGRFKVTAGPRIGISSGEKLLYRFYLSDHEHVSKRG